MKVFLALTAFTAILSAQMPTMNRPGTAPPPAPPANPNEVVLTIGDWKITAAQFEQIVRTLVPQQDQEIALGAGRRQIAQQLVEMSALAAEAQKRKLDQQPDAALQLTYARDNLLAVLMFKNLQDTTVVSDADAQAYYDAHKSEYETIAARHILIRVKGAPMPAVPGRPELTDEEARAKAEAIRKRIVAGEDFAKIAKEESDDTVSAEAGGNLTEFRRGKMVQQFEEAAFALKPGDISEPVQSFFGYHIIQVRAHSLKALADVKDEILAQLKPQAARKAVDALKSKINFDISDSFFGPPPAAVANAGGK